MAVEDDASELYVQLQDALGATNFVSAQRFSIYLPNKGRDTDGNEQEIPDLQRWVKEARDILGRINQGATEYPEMEGIWWERGAAKPTYEKTRIVYSFIDPEHFVASLPDIREFLHRFGRETRQDQVFVEFDGKAYRIEQYDPA
jgi:hypothetical protein